MLNKGKSLITIESLSLVRVYIAVIKYWENQLREERVDLSLQSHMMAYHPKESGQELKAVAWRQELKERPRKTMLTVSFPWLAQLLSYTLQEHMPRCGTTQSWKHPPTSIIYQENVLQAWLQASLTEAFSQFRYLPLR